MLLVNAGDVLLLGGGGGDFFLCKSFCVRNRERR